MHRVALVRASERWGVVYEVTRLVGINHVALEVGDIDEASAWYGRYFSFELRGRASSRTAFIDMGDQLIALMARRSQSPDAVRPFGMVVDDREAVRAALRAEARTFSRGGPLDFSDPWGNHITVVDYRETQFSKAPAVLGGMGFEGLGKTDNALAELREKGLIDT